MNSKQALKNIADVSNKINSSGGNFSGNVTIKDFQVWHAGNFNPANHKPSQPGNTGNYLPLAGGTLSGNLTVSQKLTVGEAGILTHGDLSIDKRLIVGTGGITNHGDLSVDGTTNLIGLNTTGKIIVNEDLHVRYYGRDAEFSWTDRNNFKLLVDNTSIFATNGINVLNAGVDLQVKGNNVWHNGNFSPDNYVRKTGDTITGGLTVNGNVYVGGYGIWGNSNGICASNMYTDNNMNCKLLKVREKKIQLGDIDINNDQGYLSATNIWAYNELYCNTIRIDRKRLTISQSAPGNPQTGDVWISW